VRQKENSSLRLGLEEGTAGEKPRLRFTARKNYVSVVGKQIKHKGETEKDRGTHDEAGKRKLFDRDGVGLRKKKLEMENEREKQGRMRERRAFGFEEINERFQGLNLLWESGGKPVAEGIISSQELTLSRLQKTKRRAG